MRVLRGLAALPVSERICVTVGVFDGLHRGHVGVLRAVVRLADDVDATPTVISFEPHPQQVVTGFAPPLLMDAAERLERFAAMGVGITVVQHFDEAFRRTSARGFIGLLAERGRLGALVMSAESAFGRDRAGTLEVVRAMSAEDGWDVEEAPTLELRGERVSSARIRALVSAGRLAEARQLLGRRYALVGEVVHGDARGRDMGYPTANLAFAEDVCLPPDGIYAARASWGGDALLDPEERADAAISLGTRPTFGGGERVLEVHLLDRQVELYGQRLRVEVVRRLRGQRRFDSVPALVTQMGRDVERARVVLGRSPEAL